MAVGVAVAQAAAEEKEAGILNTAAAREEGLRKAAAEREEGVRKAAAEREEGMRTAAAGREEIARLEEQLKAKEKDNEKEIVIALLQQELEHQKETTKIEKEALQREAEALQREAETAKENFSNLVSQSSVKVPRNLSRTRPSMVSSDTHLIHLLHAHLLLAHACRSTILPVIFFTPSVDRRHRPQPKVRRCR